MCSENKGADQLHSYCEADLRLCFCLFRLLVFPCGGSFLSDAALDLEINRGLRNEQRIFTLVENIRIFTSAVHE